MDTRFFPLHGISDWSDTIDRTRSSASGLFFLSIPKYSHFAPVRDTGSSLPRPFDRTRVIHLDWELTIANVLDVTSSSIAGTPSSSDWPSHRPGLLRL
jgi:hypothetical protein